MNMAGEVIAQEYKIVNDRKERGDMKILEI